MLPDRPPPVNVRRIMPPAMADLVTCPACGRANGPKRTACMYCGATLPVTDESAGVQVPTLKPIEAWERGYSVVLAPIDAAWPSPNQVERLSEIAGFDADTARAFFAAETSLPVARVGALEEADLVARLLGASGLGATVVPDDALGLATVARRVREIRLTPDRFEALVLWGDWDGLARDDVAVAVAGRVVSARVDIVENANPGKKTKEMTDASHTYSETRVLDVYGPTLDRSFRIKADSFDFSCLGGKPSFRLDENADELNELVEHYLGASRFDGAYSKLAKLLEHAWPAAATVHSYGLRARGDFKKYTKSAVTTDALAQFTRYSRLRWVLSGAAPFAPPVADSV